MKVLKIFLRLKAREIWAEGVTIKVIIGIAIYYCIGVWLFGEYVYKPFYLWSFPTKEFCNTEKYINSPLVMFNITFAFFMVGFIFWCLWDISQNISKWLRNNWQEAKRIAKKNN